MALARALAVDPSVLLLDEPFGALDATVRKSLRKELRRIHDATGVTTIFVTHDQEEALELADRVAILNQGAIEQVGKPDEVHDQPAAAFVCGFVGAANRLEGSVQGGRFRAGEIELAAPQARDGAATAFIRPHEFEVALAGKEAFFLTPERVAPNGPVVQVEGVTPGGHRIEAAFARSAAGGFTPGVKVGLSIQRAYIFNA